MHISTVATLVALMFTACTSHEFKVEGVIDNLPDGEVTVVYGTGTSMVSQHLTAERGRFTLTGYAREPMMLQIYGGLTNEPVAMLPVEGGDKLKVRVTASQPWTLQADGNSDARAVAAFMRDHASMFRDSRTDSINSAIAAYVCENPGKLAGAVLLSAWYDMRGHEEDADSLLTVADPSHHHRAFTQGLYQALDYARNTQHRLGTFEMLTRTDSTRTFAPQRQPYALLVFSAAITMQRDSLLTQLYRLDDAVRSHRLRVYDINCSADTNDWHRMLRRDTTTRVFMHGSVPGGPGSSQLRELGITQLPFYVICDSTGQQLWRGTSGTAAVNRLTDILQSKD